MNLPADFKRPLNDKFWNTFPKTELPTIVKSKIDIVALENLVEDLSAKLLPSELERAKREIVYLKNSASSCQKKIFRHVR